MLSSISIEIIYIFGLIYLCLFSCVNTSFPHYGAKIGSLKQLHHGVSGDVYAVDSRTIFIKKFNYDGEAPAAYFYVGNTHTPSNSGAYRLRDEKGDSASLTRRYRNKDITLTLPDSKTLKDIKWFSVWCDEFAVNFGDVTIPNNLDYPRPQKINGLSGVHGIKSDSIVIVDAQTLLIPNFSYDGEAPDAKFWVGQGDFPSSNGLRISDENGKETPLRRYDRKTIVLTLPDDLTIFDVGHFGIWCEAFTVDFGHVTIPKNLNVPPSLKMLGISPQSKLNCEVLYDDLAFEVRWAVAGESVVLQLVAKLENNEYMSFGISPYNDMSIMIGADVVVAWVDQESGKGFAQDYYLEDKSQCSGKRGSCPDVNILENSNSVRLLNAAIVNGYSIVTYQRSLNATDKLDLPISISKPEAIIWAIGPLNERRETSFHHHYAKGAHLIHFGREPTWKCPQPEGFQTPRKKIQESDNDSLKSVKDNLETSKSGEDKNFSKTAFYHNDALPFTNLNETDIQKSNQRYSIPTPKPVIEVEPWEIPSIGCYEPEDGTFYAQIGPTGGKHGYSAITGNVGWGIAWYINGLLIPEIHLVRGKTYTFVVEGGNNPDIPAKFHPFYITDDPVGGYEHKRKEEKKNIQIFAGVHRSRSGSVTPTGIGRLCNWIPDIDSPPAGEYQSFGAYQRTLILKCDPGEPGVITWTPDRNTPDIVYYHCFTHRYLGWKIHVHDSCDNPRIATSYNQSTLMPKVLVDEDLIGDTSIHQENKVHFGDNFSLMQQTELIKNHNMNEAPPKLSFELIKAKLITKLISDGIRSSNKHKNPLIKQISALSNSEQSSSAQYIHSTSNSISNQSKYAVDSIANIGAYYTYMSLLSAPHIGNIKNILPSIALDLLHGETKPTNQHQILHTPNKSLPHRNSNTHTTHTPTHNYHTIKNLITNSTSHKLFKVISLSDYLRPPFNTPTFHLIKVPDRRPFSGPTRKLSATIPKFPHQLQRYPPLPSVTGKIPESSMVLYHYRESIPAILKPVDKSQLISSTPSLLILDDPNNLVNPQKTDAHIYSKQRSNIQVPYEDVHPNDSIKKSVFINNFSEEIKNSNYPVKLPQSLRVDKLKPIHFSLKSASNFTKKSIHLANPSAHQTPVLSNIPVIQNNITFQDIATMKPAINEGFKPDTVIVESGFRPILRSDGPIPPPEFIEQIANRREDHGLEIDNAMETDTLFLTSQNETQAHHFEPIFIPSPTDSTNFINIHKPTVAANQLQTHMLNHNFKTLEAVHNTSTAFLPNSIESTAKNTTQKSITFNKVIQSEENLYFQNGLKSANKPNDLENKKSTLLQDYVDDDKNLELGNIEKKIKNYYRLQLDGVRHINNYKEKLDVADDYLFDVQHTQ